MRNLFNDVNENVYSVIGQMGAKNLINYPYYEKSHVESGITWTDNGDGTVTANGTATANSTFIFRYRTEQTKFVEKNTSYILSGCPSGGSTSKYLLDLFVKNQDDSNVASGFDYGNGRIINMPDQDYYGIYAFARVISGQTVSNLTFKPMLRLAADTDNTYQPYAKTNKQLTEDSVNKKTTVDSFYGTCDTAAATAAKVITVVDTANNFSLRPGVLVTVKFDNVNTANNPTFNVNNTGAKAVSYNNAVVSTDSLWAGGDSAPSLYVYDGTNWVLLAYSSYSTAQSVIVNPSSAPTGDGSIWIETT